MESAAPAKLAVDFLPGTRLRAGMDDDSGLALTVTGMQREERLAALADLDAASVRKTVLVRAAKVLIS